MSLQYTKTGRFFASKASKLEHFLCIACKDKNNSLKTTISYGEFLFCP